MNKTKFLMTASALLMAIGGAFAFNNTSKAPADLYVKVNGVCSQACATTGMILCPFTGPKFATLEDCEDNINSYPGTAYQPF